MMTEKADYWDRSAHYKPQLKKRKWNENIARLTQIALAVGSRKNNYLPTLMDLLRHKEKDKKNRARKFS